MTQVIEKSIFHTALEGNVIPLRTRYDQFKPNTIIIDFDYNLLNGYFLDFEEIVYAIYIDKEFDHEFSGTTVFIQLEVQDAVSEIDIFALPHSGFRLDLSKTQPGNKIRIRFRGRNPDIFDITAHHIQWDNGTGTFVEKEMGIIDARTGNIISGALIKSSRIIDPL